MNRRKQYSRIVLAAVVVIATLSADQVTKVLIKNNVRYFDRLEYLGGHFMITHMENRGAFLSLGNALPPALRFVLLSLLPVVAMGLMLWYIYRKNTMSNLTLIGFSCVVGGGFGNLYDRIVSGAVTDFLFIHFGVFRTGIFNLADMFIMLGIGIVLIDSFLRSGKKEGTPNHDTPV